MKTLLPIAWLSIGVVIGTIVTSMYITDHFTKGAQPQLHAGAYINGKFYPTRTVEITTSKDSVTIQGERGTHVFQF